MPKFFDENFPYSMRTEGIAEDSMKFESQKLESRWRSKSALDVARGIREVAEKEEARRRLHDQIESQIKAGFGGVPLRRPMIVPR
jgi:hypothetical protein